MQAGGGGPGGRAGGQSTQVGAMLTGPVKRHRIPLFSSQQVERGLA